MNSLFSVARTLLQTHEFRFPASTAGQLCELDAQPCMDVQFSASPSEGRVWTRDSSENLSSLRISAKLKVTSIALTSTGPTPAGPSYYLRTYMRCSLTTCHQKHRDGVLVELEDGRLSNIGHVCGASPENFGEQFARERERFADDKVRADAIRRLQDRKEILNRFDEARTIGAECGRSQLQIDTLLASFNLRVPLQVRLKDVSGRIVTEELQRDEAEMSRLIDDGLYQTRAQARYYQNRRGEIEGLAVIAPKFNVGKMFEKADRLRLMDPLSLTTRDLLTHVRGLQEVTDDIEAASRWIGDAKKFVSQKNFAVLAYLLPPGSERERLASLTIDNLRSIGASHAARQHTAEQSAARPSRRVERHAKRLEAQKKASA